MLILLGFLVGPCTVCNSVQELRGFDERDLGSCGGVDRWIIGRELSCSVHSIGVAVIMAAEVANKSPLTGGEFKLAKKPVPYSEEVARNILVRIAGGETFAAIARSDPDNVPHNTNWADWLNADRALAIAHARARELQSDALADECIAIADDATGDAYLEYDAHGKPYAKIDGDCIQRAKLKIETRIKLLAKWQPEKYGEKLLHAGHDGKKLDVPLRVDISAVLEQLRDARRQGLTNPEQPSQALIEHDDGSDLV